MQKKWFMAFASAFLLWLAWPPMPYTSLLLLVGFVPLFIAVEEIILSGLPKQGSKIFGLCFLTFFIWNTSCIYWVFNSLNAVMPSWVAVLISIIPFGLAALLMTIAFWLYSRLRRIISKRWSYAGLICFWIAYEYLHQTWQLAFPWMNLGNGFAQFHQLIQWYEFTGVYGGTLWVLISNILLFEFYLQYRSNPNLKSHYKFLSYISAVVLIPIVISLTIYYTYKEKVNPSNVVVVQPNIDPYGKWGNIPPAVQLASLIHLSDSAAQKNTEYFIWPETAIPQAANEKQIRNEPSYAQAQSFLNKYKNGTLISGIESYALYDSAVTPTATFDKSSNQYFDTFNAAIQIENSAAVQFYHKSKLVPGVESTPFASALSFMKPLFAAFGGSTGGFGTQKEPSVFYTQSGIGAAPVICYESIWGEYVGQYVLKGAQFIAIITNDAWWGNTSGKDQHFEYAKLRSIETRRWVARAANTGISGFINQRGDIVSHSSWWVATALKSNINLNETLTFYVKHGDFIALAGCFGAGLFFLLLIIYMFRAGKWKKLTFTNKLS